jgi:hypothetical protein
MNYKALGLAILTVVLFGLGMYFIPKVIGISLAIITLAIVIGIFYVVFDEIL